MDKVRGASFDLKFDSYRETYKKLRDLHKELEAAYQKVGSAKERLEGARPGGSLKGAEDCWRAVQVSASKLENDAEALDSMVKQVLNGLAKSHASYVQAEAQGRTGLLQADGQAKFAFNKKDSSGS
ncbi:hypothetical protein [Austwickia chelonae]|uniref:hypothetical protein n=1 Tax=Austwickia chelonae TaxID=100225 RepID=UPI0013C2E0EE|nr:hypothetical protein [Austwickia chelonae]